jgi:tetratricopeptide (TPR) repeat protein
VERLLSDACGGRSGALLVEGEPGVGKTSLLRHAIELAGSMTVVRATGIETEAELEFSGLLEVCRPLLDGVDGLPAPQAHALRGALGLEPERPRDRFAIGVATLGLLALAAERRPLLVVLDDAQWLDAASTDALCFAARRLLADRVAVLAAARTDEAPSFVAAGLERIVLDGLDPEAARRLVERAGAAIAPDVVERLHALTGGNPLGLAESSAALSDEQRAGLESLPDPLPVGSTLERTYAGRLGAMPASTRAALVVLALAGDADHEAVMRALALLGTAPAALEAAEDAGLVVPGADGPAFRHPLVRSAVAHSARAGERRAAHLALAEALAVTGDPERRAWQLASAAEGPDEEVAAELAAAATRARMRTGYRAASRAFERAARLSPDAEARRARLGDAADSAFTAGESRRAAVLADEAVAACADGAARAALLRLRGRIELQTGAQRSAREFLLAAADAAEPVDRDSAVGALSLAVFSCHSAGRIAQALELAQRARALAARDGGAADQHADYVLGRSLLLAGHYAVGRPILERLLELWLGEADQPRINLARTATTLAILERGGELHGIVARVEQLAREEGPMALTYALTLVAEIAAREARWREAVAAASEGLALARELGQDNIAAHLLAALTLVAAVRGGLPRGGGRSPSDP